MNPQDPHLQDPRLIELPMFPLGSVLLPGGVLPLHIFETRYQQLLNHALESDRRFGVVLITRGSEVGGGDQRANIGTVAHIDDYQRFDDGRAAVVSTGHDRIEVVDWLDDDPYPRARVRELAVESPSERDRILFAAARQSLDELVDLGRRLGRLESAPEPHWDSDIEAATWQLARRSPCSALDQYQLLSLPTRAARLAKIDELLKELYADLELMGGLDER